MTGALAPIISLLARLIPRLSSPFDGEVVATARAIERTLKSKGLDFNDFAEAISHPEPEPRDRPQPPPAEPFRRSDQDSLRRDQRRVQSLLLAPGRLSANDIDFLRSIRDRLSGGRPLTFGQNKWLADIEARARREHAR